MRAATSGESRIVATSEATERRGTVALAKRATPRLVTPPEVRAPRGLVFCDFQVDSTRGVGRHEYSHHSERIAPRHRELLGCGGLATRRSFLAADRVVGALRNRAIRV